MTVRAVVADNAATEVLIRRYWYLIDARDWAGMRTMLHDDFVGEASVSGERFIGADTFVQMNAEYPGGWALTLVRLVVDGERVASEVRFRLGGKVDHALSFFETRDGKLVWQADWWPEPYPAPASRAHLASPAAPLDPRLVWLDRLDDAREEVLTFLQGRTPSDLVRSQPGGTRPVVDLLAVLMAHDETALANVRFLMVEESPNGWGGQNRPDANAVAGQPDRAPETALAGLYRARADLRLALWTAPRSIWDQDPVQSPHGEVVSLPRLCEVLSERDREWAAELRTIDGD